MTVYSGDEFYDDDVTSGVVDEDWDCSWCAGEGLTECDDPIQCTRPHYDGWCECSACGGTGLRSKQTVF